MRRADPAPRLPSPADPFDAGPYSGVQARLRLPPAASSRTSWRRALALGIVAWVPLLVLSAVEAVRGVEGALASFLLDVSTHARYLFALPLLVAAEPWCLLRLALVARHFSRGGLVVGDERFRLQALVLSTRDFLRHPRVEVGLVIAAYAVAATRIGIFYRFDGASWAAAAGGGAGGALSAAGWWRTLVSHPLFLLFLGIWSWRVAAWWRFLWGVSRLHLRLVPAHPDLAGGVRFVGTSLGAFAPVGFALGTIGAGTLAADLLRDGRTSLELGHLSAVGGALAIAAGVLVAPLLFFTGPLRRARLRGLVQYGALAGAMGRTFEKRWLDPDREIGDDALDVNDFSATTDLYSIVANVQRSGLLPIGLRELTPLVVATLVPFLPVLLIVLPVDELIRHILLLFV